MDKMDKMKKRTKIGLFVGVILAGLFSGLFHYHYSTPFEVERDIWTPASYKAEVASEVFLSGTALVKPLEEYKERFADAETTIVLAGEELYYITKEEGLTYVAIESYRPYSNLREFIQGKIVGQKVFLMYEPDLKFEISFGLLIPIATILIFTILGAIAANRAEGTNCQ